MLAPPSILTIEARLRNAVGWRPNSVRYACAIFWNDEGFQRLRASPVTPDLWQHWCAFSGDFWDVHLAGCYRHATADTFGSTAEPLSAGAAPLFWSREKAAELAGEVSQRAQHANDLLKGVGDLSARERVRLPNVWHFGGPLEFVAIPARRLHGDVEVDWASAASVRLQRPHRMVSLLASSMSVYTKAYPQFGTLTDEPESRPAQGPNPTIVQLLGDVRQVLPTLVDTLLRANSVSSRRR